MPFSHITHHMERVPGSDMSTVTRVTPIIRLSAYAESINVQGGNFWTDGGQRVDNPPGWVYDELEKLSMAARHEAGFPGGRLPGKPDNAPAAAPVLDPPKHRQLPKE